MNTKQIQVKHWQKCKYRCPHNTTLEMFWHRSGIKATEDETIMRTFRLEIKHSGKCLFKRLARTYKPDYSLAA